MFSRNVKVLIIITYFLSVIILYNKWPSRIKENPVLKAKIGADNERNMKYILFWTPFWYTPDYFIGFGSKIFSECEYTNCFTTNNRSYLSVDKFDAILFHGSIYNKNYHKEPAIRSPNQMYVYVNIEAPINLSPNLRLFGSFYNWTMTHRFDSDIVKRYRNFIKEETDYVFPSFDVIKNKTKIMAWFVSHCSTSSKRELLIKHIMKHIPVDIYGNCGPLKCPVNRLKLSTNECYNMVEKNYKFYFAGENSICKDYTTEKLYYLLEKNVVPVVYGGGNYSVNAPPKSVINVADFKNVTQLVNYLKFLDDNPSEYLKYFEWKKHYKIIDGSPGCQLCKKLNEPLQKTVIEDLHKWSWGVNNEICQTVKNLPTIVGNLL